MESAFSILHITDFHIENWLPSGYELKITHAVDAVISKVDGKRLFVVISGDVANTGIAAEYDKANKVISCLVQSLKDKLEDRVELLMVPGNHDIFNPPKSVPDERDEKSRLCQLEKLDDYLCFSLCMGIDWDDKDVIVASYPLPADTGFSGVRFCCLNTAPFSTLSFDKGVHILSAEAFRALRKDSPSEISIVVAHHGPDWLDDSPRLEFEAEADTSIDILLVGHEHRGETRIENYSSDGVLPVFRGGTFSLNDEKECNFTVLNIGRQQKGAYKINENRFDWDSSSRIFVPRKSKETSFVVKGLVPRPKDSFFEKLADDIGQQQDFFNKAFSFPRLRGTTPLLTEDDDLVARQSVDVENTDDFFLLP